MPQQRFLLESKLGTHGVAYNLPYLFQISGQLNVAALKQAFNYYVNNLNEGCRTYFIELDGQPVQVITNKVSVEIQILDLSDKKKNKQKRFQQEFVDKIINMQFDLEKAQLFRFGLVKQTSSEHLLVANFHHIIFDGITYLNFIKQVSELYNHYANRKELSKDLLDKQKDLSIQNYIDHEKKYSAKNLKKDLDYWQGYMSGAELGSNLPYQKQAEVSGNLAKSVSFTLDETLTKKLKEIAKAEKSNLFRIISLLYGVLLGRYCGQDEVVLSYAVHLLPQEMQGLNGCFVNNLPLRVGVDSQKSFKELLKELDSARRAGRNHQSCSFTSIADALKEQGEDQSLNVGISESPELLNLHNLELDGLKIKSLQIDEVAAIFDLNLAYEVDKSIHFRIDYAAAKFDRGLIERFSRHFRLLIDCFVSDIDKPAQDIEILSANERKQILVDWNGTAATYPKDKTIHQLFEEQVLKTPNSIAIVFEDEKLSYSQLNKKSNQLARLIRDKYKAQNKKDLKPDSLIGLCVKRSLDMIIGILGILKAGGAYVPLDPDYPQDRLEYMLEDTNANLILTQINIVMSAKALNHIKSYKLLVIDSDKVKADLAKQSIDNLYKVSGPNNLAYVIYTSGSTGRPKGVLLPHHNVLRLFLAIDDQYKFSNKDVWTLFHSYAFDFSVWEIWGALLHGGKLIVVPHMVTRDPELFYDLVCDKKVTVLNQTPGAFQQFIGVDDQRAKKIDSLRYVIFGGDALNIEILRPWWENHADNKPLLVNMYGITETTVHVTYSALSTKHLVESNSGLIGKPIKDLQAYALDKNHNVCPIGASGELYVGGAGLARGYLNQDELTRERFISNPFAKELGLPDTDRIYKTGDLVRWLPDGNIEYLGRTDFQVKIRGFRIELGEIENVLAKHKAISQITVIDKENEEQKYLVAYYVIAKDKKEPEIHALRDYLSEVLPDYMMPTAFVKLDAMPLTPNGKINRRALPDPDMSLMGEEYVAPRTEVEEKLADIWRDVLQLERVGIHDNFFQVGGHSLLAIKLVSSIHAQLNCEIAIKEVFNKPKLVDLALLIDNKIKSGEISYYVAIHPVERLEEGNVLSFAQERLWFLDQYEQGVSANYNMPMVLKLEGDLNVAALEQAINQLIERHESLRTFFESNSGVPVQKVLSSVTVSFASNEVSEADVLPIIDKDIHKPFDLSVGPLLRANLFKVSDYYVLLVNQHHIIGDGWSMGVMIRELNELYGAIVENRVHKLEPLNIQYIDFASWEIDYLTSKKQAVGLSYWTSKLQDYVPLNLALDKPRPRIQSMRGGHYCFSIDATTTSLLNTLCKREGATLAMALLAAYQILLGRLSGQDDVVVGMAIANRNHKDIKGLIGFFVNILPMRSTVSFDDTFITVLSKAKEDAFDAYEYQSIPFERIVDEMQVERTTDLMPLLQHVLVLQNAHNTHSFKFPGIKVSELDSIEFKTTKTDLTFSCVEKEGVINVRIEYSSDIFNIDTIKRLASQYDLLLDTITDNPNELIKNIDMLPASERKQILVDWNGTAATYPKDKTIHQLFEEQVLKTPNSIAIVFEDEKLSYSQLNKKSNQLARLIRDKYKAQNKKDLKPDSLIGLCVERSLDMIIGILGILKAGAAYVPLDPDYPQDRLEYMIKDANVSFILTQINIVMSAKALNHIKSYKLLVIDSDKVKADLAKQSIDNLYKVSGPNNLAYVIYTSGSTGRPKGVLLPHHNVLRLFLAIDDQYKFSNKDVWTLFHSYAFDFSVWEIWGALLHGGQVNSCSAYGNSGIRIIL